MKPKVLVMRTAGTNCDKESVHAFKLAGADVTLEHINHIKKTKDLSQYQILCIPGGFSYGDDLGAGKILSLELMLWLGDELRKFVKRGGLIIGICNGFQVLVKTGILPDDTFKQTVTLTDNDSSRFEDRWVYLKVSGKSVWLKNLPEIISLPIAHGEGKFYTEKKVLDKLVKNNQIALKYVDSGGNSSKYPLNPNGSLLDIAGIIDKSGRIFGLMPHPERCMFSHHLPFWTQEVIKPWGLQIFKNAVESFK